MKLTKQKEDNYFLSLFLEFFTALKRAQAKINSKGKLSEEECVSMRKELAALLKAQGMKVSMNAGAFVYDSYREMQYALCALVDEIMINTQWSGNQWWKNYLLEREFFQTHIAGEQIFKNIDIFLDRQDKYKQHLGMVYVYLLSLGFKGKYNKHPDEKEVLKKYKEDLFLFMYGNKPVELFEQEHLFNETLIYNISDNLLLDHYYFKRWWKLLLYMSGIYLILSYGIWWYHTAEISSITTKINGRLVHVR